MRLRITHTLHALSQSPVPISRYELRLMPLSDATQTCLDFRLTTLPPAESEAIDQPQGRLHRLLWLEACSEVQLTVESLVVTHLTDPFRRLQFGGNDAPFYRQPALRELHRDYLTSSPCVPLGGARGQEMERITTIVQQQADTGTTSFLVVLTRALHRAFFAMPPKVMPETTALVLSRAHRDLLHLMVGICRQQRIPARCVSGYFVPREALAPSEQAIERATLHAWVECLLPDGQWHGFDPLHNGLANDSYVTLHYGRDYSEILPLRSLTREDTPPTFQAQLQITLT